MNMQTWITGLWVPILVVVATLLAASFRAIWKKLDDVSKEVASGIAAAKQAASEADKALHQRVDELSERLADFRHECAMTFLSKNDAERAFDQLNKRTERIEQKMDDVVMMLRSK